MSRGIDRERDLRLYLESRGWVCVRAAGSLGPVDIVALHSETAISLPDMTLSRAHFFEVKSTVTPFSGFSPEDRAYMIGCARQAGARAILAWWPKCRPGQSKEDALTFIPSAQWPGQRDYDRHRWANIPKISGVPIGAPLQTN